MLGPQILLLLVLLPLCVFAPGLVFVRRFRWSPLEKLCGSAGLSLILLYLASFVIYWSGLGVWSCRAVAAACVVAAVAARRDAARILRAGQVRKTLLAYGFLLIWTLAFLGGIRHYSGGGWLGDWVEHFQRSLFFLQHLPRDVAFSDVYPLPARPPLMNLLGAFFLANTADRFELFQIAFAFLNLLAFLPCCLLMPALTGRRRRILPLAGLFALNPMFMENATYAWTKLLTVFFVALSIGLYVAAMRKRDGGRFAAAFAAMAAGLLTHYSAGPYLVFLAGHYWFRVSPGRPRRWREAGIVAALCVGLPCTWFAWSFHAYGVRATLASNTSVNPADGSGHGLAKIAGNLADTLVPHPLRADANLDLFAQPSATGWWRDYFFVMYQTNVVAAMGMAGGLVALVLLARAFWKGRTARAVPERRFWLLLVPICTVLGVAVAGERDPFGQAHLTLQPLVMLGVTLVAGSLAYLPRAAAWFVLAGCALDFGLGIWLQARVERLENTPSAVVFPAPRPVDGATPQLTVTAWTNWYLKRQYELSGAWMERLGRLPDPGAPEAAALRAQLQRARDADAVAWNGWRRRHGGAMTFLGDHLGAWQAAGAGAPDALMAALFLAVMAALAREAKRGGARPAGIAERRPQRPGRKRSHRASR